MAVLSLEDDPKSRAARARRRARYTGKRSGAGDRILSYAELHEGDYVVHAAHGIGRFLGIETLTVDGTASDYITLQYAGEEKLFLRADKLELVSRYIGAGSDSGNVRLSKIGGAAWGTAKARAKAAAEVCGSSRQAYLNAMIGTEVEVLFEQSQKGLWSGHCPQYCLVKAEGSRLSGEVRRVRITAADGENLFGEIL
jgi:hypothetical protein